MDPDRFLALVFDHFDFQNTARESHCVNHLRPSKKNKKKKTRSHFLYLPDTISKLNSRVETIVKLLKQSRWSNCLINSREDVSYYYSAGNNSLPTPRVHKNTPTQSNAFRSIQSEEAWVRKPADYFRLEKNSVYTCTKKTLDASNRYCTRSAQKD